MRILMLGLGVLTLCISSLMAFAAPVTTTGAGSAVSSQDRLATFDGISGSLLNYTEDGLLISVGGEWCCFPDAHYDDTGNFSYVTIATVDGSDFYGLEFDFGTGWGEGLHNVVWETQRDGITTGSGVLTNIFNPNGFANPALVLGWLDVALFDTLLVGSGPTADGYVSFGQHNAIALDNVKIDYGSPVPIPAALPLFAGGLGLLGWMARRKRRQLA